MLAERVELILLIAHSWSINKIIVVFVFHNTLCKNKELYIKLLAVFLKLKEMYGQPYSHPVL
jgi:hypothetical protein